MVYVVATRGLYTWTAPVDSKGGIHTWQLTAGTREVMIDSRREDGRMERERESRRKEGRRRGSR